MIGSMEPLQSNPPGAPQTTPREPAPGRLPAEQLTPLRAEQILQEKLYTRRHLSAALPLDLKEGAVLPFYKPLDWTSFDLVNKFRYAARTATGHRKIKVGHAGTLDPKACGVMLLCSGKCTKISDLLMGHTKQYVATLQLGVTTPSYDAEHQPDAYYPARHITRGMIEALLPRFVGHQSQVPPVYSAVSVNGSRAYKSARRGKNIDIPPKQIYIADITLLSWEAPFLTLQVTCGRGTYIRALARDIGRALGSGAYLTALERTQVGSVSAADCFRLEELPRLMQLVPPPQES